MILEQNEMIIKKEIKKLENFKKNWEIFVFWFI